MPQNIYDNDSFFAGYATLARSQKGLDAAGEWPALRALLPPMQNLRVVDLGCGYGWFCRWAREQGATSILGLDLSEKMLARAAETTPDPAITYQRADLSALTLPPASFDLAYSSLALHYLPTLAPLFTSVHNALAPAGRFVFSIEHPLFMAPTNPAFLTLEDGSRIWPLDNYLAEGRRETTWFAPGVVKYHRTIATTLTEAMSAGFRLTAIQEWGPTDEQIAQHPSWADERIRPPFLLVALEK
jgi:SAM-dependent methyltransferase